LRLFNNRLVRKVFPQRYPEQVLLDTCTFCSASCFYCLHQRKHLVKPSMMSLDVFDSVTTILAKDKVRKVSLFQSGEPFLNDDIYAFITRTAYKGMNSITATKLYTLLDYKLLDSALSISDWCHTKVVLEVTIDSFIKETMFKISPGIKVDVVKTNLNSLIFLLSHHSSLRVTCSTIVNRFNEAELPDIKERMEGMGFEWCTQSFGYYMSSWASEADIKMVEDYLPLNPSYRKRLRVDQGQIIGVQKMCPYAMVPVIDNLGNVFICCHDMTHSLNLGNMLKEGSLRKVIDSAAFRSAYKASQKKQLDICKGCN
jgi:hypothetical protein